MTLVHRPEGSRDGRIAIRAFERMNGIAIAGDAVAPPTAGSQSPALCLRDERLGDHRLLLRHRCQRRPRGAGAGTLRARAARHRRRLVLAGRQHQPLVLSSVIALVLVAGWQTAVAVTTITAAAGVVQLVVLLRAVAERGLLASPTGNVVLTKVARPPCAAPCARRSRAAWRSRALSPSSWSPQRHRSSRCCSAQGSRAASHRCRSSWPDRSRCPSRRCWRTHCEAWVTTGARSRGTRRSDRHIAAVAAAPLRARDRRPPRSPRRSATRSSP